MVRLGQAQAIFEYNTIRPGGTELSWGNNLDNYSPGYCQHVYHAHNHFQNVWAGDRELMTTDPVYGDYFGPVGSVHGTTLTLSAAGEGHANGANVGGAVSVLEYVCALLESHHAPMLRSPPSVAPFSGTLSSHPLICTPSLLPRSGTGAGQYRRISKVLDKSTVVLDQPFVTPLDPSSRVQLGPFKGRFIFYANRYEDGGAFQLYANNADVVVAKHRFARTPRRSRPFSRPSSRACYLGPMMMLVIGFI